MIPMFVMTYPTTVVREVDDEYELDAHFEDEIRENLVSSIQGANKNVEDYHRCLGFRMDRPFDISQEYLCMICGCEMTEPGWDFCDDCVDENMDTDSEEDNCEVLTEEFGSRLDIGPSKQTSSSVN